MTREAHVVAQAKVNLRLRVLAREASGYHGLETLFLRLDLGDEVRVRVGIGGRVVDCGGPECPSAGLGPPERNLAYRAAIAYADATGWPRGFAIEIDKRVPVGGGLGGGSADAGAVLRALDALAPVPLGARLPTLAAALGADVPFLTLDSPMALAWGRGERLLPLRAPPSRRAVLLAPPFAVATADAYAWLAASRGPFVPEVSVLAPASLDSWAGLAAVAVNDFEAVVAARHPAVAVLVDALRARGASPALMSGSGSVVFGVLADRADVGALAATVAPTGARLLETRTAERVVRVRTAE